MLRKEGVPGLAFSYGAAVLFTAVALGVTILIEPYLGGAIFPLFLGSVIATAWLAGTGPGLLSIGLAAFGVDFFILGPRQALGLTSGGTLIPLVNFAVVAVFTVWLIGTSRSSERRVRAMAEELKRRRDRQEAAERSATLGSWEWDVTGDQVIWSDELYRIYGLEPRPSMSLVETMSLAHPDDRELFASVVQEAMRTGQPYEFDHRIVRPDGTIRWMNGRGIVEMGSDGKPRRFAGSSQDITERRQAEALQQQLTEDANEARRQAEIANRAKADFLATMSHELRTPLNAIAGYAELLEMGVHGELTQTQLDTVRRVQRSQRHLLGLVEQLLNFAKVEAGKLDLRLDTVPLTGLLERMGELVAPQALAKQITYTCEGGDTALTVHADAERVEQIVLNLLANAVKFTGTGGWVKLTTQALVNEVAIRVSDSGIGIPADKIDKVFEPFVQLPRRDVMASGIGLGLAISRELARAMGGDVSATSEPGVGSTFTLRLPRALRH